LLKIVIAGLLFTAKATIMIRSQCGYEKELLIQ